jgi:hypothetical protein
VGKFDIVRCVWVQGGGLYVTYTWVWEVYVVWRVCGDRSRLSLVWCLGRDRCMSDVHVLMRERILCAPRACGESMCVVPVTVSGKKDCM